MTDHAFKVWLEEWVLKPEVRVMLTEARANPQIGEARALDITYMLVQVNRWRDRRRAARS